MTRRASNPPNPALPELLDLRELLMSGYLDGWAPTATSLLDWPRYRDATDPVETLAADIRHVITYMPEPERRDLLHIIPTDAERPTTQNSRWEEIRGSDSGSALKWRGQYLLMRLLEALRERGGSDDLVTNPPGCQILAVEANLRLAGARHETRITTLAYRLRSTRDDFRVFTFNRANPTKGKIIEGTDVEMLGNVPVQTGATVGAYLFAVYLGRSVPRGEEVSFAVQFEYPAKVTDNPWLSYAAKYGVGRVMISIDAPTSVAKSYDRIEYNGTQHLAKELKRIRVRRTDDKPMTFPVSSFVPLHKYRLAWHEPGAEPRQ
jgi:hypothetical protein